MRHCPKKMRYPLLAKLLKGGISFFGKSAVQLDVPDAVSGRVAEAETEVIDNAGAVAENNA